MIRDPAAAALVARVVAFGRRRYGERYRATYVWGSHARDDAIETSDVDVGVFVRGAMTRDERDAADEELWTGTGSEERLDSAIVPDSALDGRDAVSLRHGARLVDGEDVGATLALPTREQWTDLCDEEALAVLARRRAKPLALPLAALRTDDLFLGYVCRTTVTAAGAVVPSTKEPLNHCGRVATALVARASGRLVGDRPQAIAAYAQDVADAWAPFLLDLQECVRVRWKYQVPEAPADRAHLAALCGRALAFERRFVDMIAAGGRGPRADAIWRKLTGSATVPS